MPFTLSPMPGQPDDALNPPSLLPAMKQCGIEFSAILQSQQLSAKANVGGVLRCSSSIGCQKPCTTLIWLQPKLLLWNICLQIVIYVGN